MSSLTYLSCPVLTATADNSISALQQKNYVESSELPIYYLDVDAEIHVAVAFVSVRVSFLNVTENVISGILKIPTYNGRATVCSCDITFAGKTFSTSVIDPKVQKFSSNQSLAEAGKGLNGKDVSTYDANEFSMPFVSCPPRSEIVVVIKYVQSLDFDCTNGNFFLALPTKIPPRMMYQDQSMDQCLSVSVLLNPGTSTCQWSCETHELAQEVQHSQETAYNQQLMLRIAKNGPNHSRVQNAECIIKYMAWAPTISGSCIVQYPSSPGEDGSFIIFVSPPAVSAHSAAESFRRRKIVFLLDHSGSMGGPPMEEAKSALCTALDQLHPFDEFAILAFDDHLEGYNHSLLPATASNLHYAKTWVQTLRAQGGTDIHRALTAANSLLSGQPAFCDVVEDPLRAHHRDDPNGFDLIPPEDTGHHAPPGFTPAHPSNIASNSANKYALGDAHDVIENGSQQALSIVVLVTDGAVNNDKEIIQYATRESQAHPDRRVYTFGIGAFCNKYFLRMLAVQGKGHSDVCLSTDTIASQMVALMSKTNGPVLCDIDIMIPGISPDKISVYPDTIPDLTLGAPLILAGKYSTFNGSFPNVIQMSGSDSRGSKMVIQIVTCRSITAPISQLVDKCRLDLLVGKWWMSTGSEQARLEKLAIDTSTTSGIPCAFTQSIAYENPEAAHGPQDGYRPTPQGFTPTIHPNPRPCSDNSSSERSVVPKNKARPAMIGGAIVVGSCVAAALAFGSVSATMSNVGVGEIADFMSSISGFGLQGVPNVDLDFSQCCCCSVPEQICGCNPMHLCGCNDSCNGIGRSLQDLFYASPCADICTIPAQICGSNPMQMCGEVGQTLQGCFAGLTNCNIGGCDILSAAGGLVNSAGQCVSGGCSTCSETGVVQTVVQFTCGALECVLGILGGGD